MIAAVVPRPPWCLTPGAAAYNNQRTMAAVVGNLRHDVSTDIVGLLWVVLYVEIRRVVYLTIGDVSPTK